MIKPGSVISASDALKDSFFAGADIVVIENNGAGAVGFIVNKRHNRSLNELEEFSNVNYPLHLGGPMDQEHLFFIHTRPDLIGHGSWVGGDLYFGGDFSRAIDAVRSNKIDTRQIKIFVGYCGWDSNELEAEIEEGSWKINPEINIFSP